MRALAVPVHSELVTINKVVAVKSVMKILVITIIMIEQY